MSFSRHFAQPFFFQTERIGNEATLHFCVIPAIARYTEYISRLGWIIFVYILMEIHAKLMH